jgi:N-acetylmuramate 1-kinase
MADRAAAQADFLTATGWGAAERRHLAGDASDRRYERLRLGAATAVLMDSPPGGADDPAAFVAMSVHLRQLGLSAPEVLAQNLDHGFLLLEDLGDDLYARLLTTEPGRELALYAAATDCLLHLQASPPPKGCQTCPLQTGRRRQPLRLTGMPLPRPANGRTRQPSLRR